MGEIETKGSSNKSSKEGYDYIKESQRRKRKERLSNKPNQCPCDFGICSECNLWNGGKN